MNKKLFELSYSVRKDFEKKIFFAFFFVICIFAAINILINFVVFPVRTVSASMEPDQLPNCERISFRLMNALLMVLTLLIMELMPAKM